MSTTDFNLVATCTIEGVVAWIPESDYPALEKLVKADLDGVIFTDADGNWREAVDRLRAGYRLSIREREEPAPGGGTIVRHVLRTLVRQLVKIRG